MRALGSTALDGLARFLPREAGFVGAGKGSAWVEARGALDHLYAFSGGGYGVTREEMQALVALDWATSRLLWQSPRSMSWRVDLTELGKRMRDQLARTAPR